MASIRSDLPTIYMAELAIAKQAAGSAQLNAFDDPTVSTSMPLYSERDWQFAWNNETQRFSNLQGTRTSVAPAQATSLLGQPSLWLARHAASPTSYAAQKGITANLSITLSEAYRLQPQNGGEPLYLARYTVSSKVNDERDELQGLIALSSSASNGGTLVPTVCNNLATSAPGNASDAVEQKSQGRIDALKDEVPSPETWIAKINKLRRAGKLTEAEKSLKKTKRLVTTSLMKRTTRRC